MTDALICTHLHKTFGNVIALDDVNLTVHPGQLTALLGPSGCGKTTTLRLIAGFEIPDRGRIAINGQAVAGDGLFVEPEARRIGMVFQDYALFPHLTIADNIAFGLRRDRRERARRVEDLLALVGLSGYGGRMPYALSGGQQQRVALARALAPDPTIILLDEPFSNLDTALRAQVRADVRAILRAAGTTSVFVTHDQEEALGLADEVAIMLEGRIAQIAPPQQLYRHPASKAVAAFVGESNFLPGEASGTRVDCVLGQLPLMHAAHGPVDVLIRPEALRLTESPDGSAQIIWREFYGHDQRIGLQLADGTTLVVRADSEQVFNPGQRVTVALPGPVQVFARTAGVHT
jgi:iron(III) transport system ATP-binding protein